MKAVQDEATYERMTKPYETEDEATVQMEAFFEAVAQLRKEYRLADVTIAVATKVTAKDSTESNGLFSCAHYGDSAMAPILAAQVIANSRKEKIMALAGWNKTILGIIDPKWNQADEKEAA